jgi:hypothetical protein
MSSGAPHWAAVLPEDFASCQFVEPRAGTLVRDTKLFARTEWSGNRVSNYRGSHLSEAGLSP